ncbi:MAG: hypothetical protein AAF322_02755 [Pseudomonadota bacterium]
MTQIRWRSVAICGAAAAGLLVAGCASKPEPKGPTPFDKTVVADCYTVDLFTKTDVVEPTDVPDEWRGFSGRWGGAAWDGKWCHDLHVLSIDETGEVEVMELHAPYEQWGKTATAFRRKAYISKDGRLRLRYAGVDIEYWLEDGRLHGLRREGSSQLRIALSRGVNKRFEI